MHTFQTKLQLIGVNPFVFVPEKILDEIFKAAGKNRGPVKVKGEVNRKPYKQTLVRFKGEWRLYINMKMLKDSPKRIGETVLVTIGFDSEDRSIPPHPKWLKALSENQEAHLIYKSLRPSLQHEIIRYIASLKTEAAIEKNCLRAIRFLLGKDRFIGRDKIE
ncbi:MAG: DUF1905 domain-containing protein [Chitinophagales bacterium]